MHTTTVFGVVPPLSRYSRVVLCLLWYGYYANSDTVKLNASPASIYKENDVLSLDFYAHFVCCGCRAPRLYSCASLASIDIVICPCCGVHRNRFSSLPPPKLTVVVMLFTSKWLHELLHHIWVLAAWLLPGYRAKNRRDSLPGNIYIYILMLLPTDSIAFSASARTPHLLAVWFHYYYE